MYNKKMKYSIGVTCNIRYHIEPTENYLRLFIMLYDKGKTSSLCSLIKHQWQSHEKSMDLDDWIELYERISIQSKIH